MYGDVTIWANNIENRTSAALAALRYADQFNGTVTAVYAKLNETEVRRWQTNTSMDLLKKMLADMDQAENDCRQTFEEFSKKFDCKTIWRTASESDKPVQHMLCTDLIVLDQPVIGEHNNAIEKSFLNRIILETKRPVLMVPDGWDQNHIPAKIALGWNSSAEAMRAVSDALPFMLVCEQVGILCIFDDRTVQQEQAGVYQIRDYLTRKQIYNELIIEACQKYSFIPQKFLEYTKSFEADLIVVGGYGHSRLRELILGGMTDHLISNASVPVLFSH